MLVFIIAGIGDHTDYIKKRTNNWNAKYGLEPVVMRFGWRGDYEQNYADLKRIITERAGREKFALIGISAGAAVAIKLSGEFPNAICAVTICGRTSRGGFQVKRFKSHPAYWNSVDNLETVKSKLRVLVIKPLFDEVVSIKHMNFKNAKTLNVPYLFHVPSIFLILSRQSDQIAKFIKSNLT